jgi:hypothetical protein
MDGDFWKRQWDVFLSAPVPSLFFLAIGAIAAWWFRGTVGRGEINELNARIAALEERLRLAADRVQQAADAKERLEADLQKLGEQIDAGASTRALEMTTLSAESNLVLLNKWENETRAALGQPIRRMTVIPRRGVQALAYIDKHGSLEGWSGSAVDVRSLLDLLRRSGLVADGLRPGEVSLTDSGHRLLRENRAEINPQRR